MSWVQELYDTYEHNIGITHDNERRQLMPIGHINQKAQIEVVIDKEGNFQSATKVDKENAMTLIPATAASETARTSKPTPHPLNDTLSYIAGDYIQHLAESDKKARKLVKDKHDAYLKELNKWCIWENAHPKVKSICTYLKKDCLVADLIKAGIVGVDGQGVFDRKRIGGNHYDKAMVRFRVTGFDTTNTATWTDVSLIENYIEYYRKSQTGEKQFCYISGETRTVAEKHPPGILASNYGAKLISVNDTDGFSFRGRFIDASQACSIGEEASKKIHSALTWLVENQGWAVGTKNKRVFICWSPSGKETPDVLLDLGFESEEYSSIDIDYKQKLKKIFKGYRENFNADDKIDFIALEAATKGRLSITYYSEQNAWEFIKHAGYWFSTVSWMFISWDKNKKKFYHEEKTPSFQTIVNCAFGTERDKKISSDDRIAKEQVQRLIKCMVDRQPFPFDIVVALTNKASNLQIYSTITNREKVLSTACAVIVKYYIDKGIIKEDEDVMKLDTSNNDRSYLFGRLLAVLERAERVTYDADESRETNAMRLQSAFCNHPMTTWQTLNQALMPYFQKMSPASREYYRRMISEITELFQEEDARIMNQALKETYLLGYYLQRAELNKKKETTKTEEEN